MMRLDLFLFASLAVGTTAFTTNSGLHKSQSRLSSSLHAEKVAKEVTGAELEVMLQEWDQPLLLDAYATWCGPCLLMAPHFEEAAKEFEGKVRFVKMDTDKEPEMAARLNIMGLPTLMFLDELKPEDADNAGEAKAALLNKIEGAITKDSIIDLCNYHFFDGPMPTAPEN